MPKIFNVLYRHNPNFTGRFEAMESLQKSLHEGNAAITAVAGLGGVGKTTLAAEYCHRFGGRYGGVWWVRAEQKSVILTDIATLGQRLGLAATGNIEADSRAALENLASRTEPWLMVYDNAPNADAVSEWLPAGGVRCLITSRFAGFDSIATVTKLGQWTDEVTADYLILRTGRSDRSGALRLAHSLGGLPLAAEQAAVFLKDRKGISFDDYASEISRLIKEEKPPGAKGDYPDTVYAAFVKSLEALERMKNGKTALDFLRLCSFLSPDGVDLGLLIINWGDKVLPVGFAVAITDKYKREDALAALASLSLLRQEDGPAGNVLIFHRLLLEVARDWMGAASREVWGTAAVRLAALAFPFKVDVNNWEVCARLVTHIAPLEAYAPRTAVAREHLGHLLNQAGIYLEERGDFGSGLTIAEKALALGRETESLSPQDLAGRLNNLGVSFIRLDRLDNAEAIYKEVLDIATAHFPENDRHLAIALSNLAGVYRQRKEFAKAEPLFLRASEIMKIVHGPTSADYSTSLSNLGTLYGDWSNEPGQAERRALAEHYQTEDLLICVSASGPRHPATAISRSNLAVMKARLGRWAEAAHELEKSLAIMLSLDLAQHPATELRADALVTMWQRSGQHGRAARLQGGDVSDLMPVIVQIEAEQRAWVAEDPKNHHFGPPSPFAAEKN